MPKSSPSSHLKQCLGSGLYELGESSFSQSSNTCKLSPENSFVDFSQDPYLVVRRTSIRSSLCLSLISLSPPITSMAATGSQKAGIHAPRQISTPPSAFSSIQKPFRQTPPPPPWPPSPSRLLHQFLHQLDFSGSYGCRSWLTDEKKKGRILPVRYQGNTNACYAFAIATTIGGVQGLEGCRCSEQELLDRLHIDFPPCGVPVPYKDVPVQGLRNNFENGFGYAKKHGIYFEKDYPWVGRYQPEQPNNLPLNPEKIYVKDFKSVDNGNHKLIVEQLEKQPLAGGIITTRTFRESWGFEDIIYEGPSTEESEAMKYDVEEANKKGLEYHAVTLVGYGRSVEGSNDYYLCQNSYGPNWGHHGYFKVRRDAVFSVRYPVGVYKAKKNINGVVLDMEVDTITSSSDDMEVDTMLSSSDDMEIDEVAMDID